ncbi:F-box domain containing protein [Tanacetum coccineum]
MLRDSCGLGFDASTNTLKMVCVLCKSNMVSDNPDVVKKDLCTMVHVLGTNSWREIPQVPSYPITAKAVFVKGCLHWLVSDLDVQTDDGGRPVIWFDVEKEEFGLIDPPKRMCDLWRKYSCRYQVVDLNGEVGYVCTKTMEFWLLNHKKEWVPHCRFKEEIVPDGYIDVMGCWNKDGDILIRSMDVDLLYMFYVYNLKSGVLHKTNLANLGVCPVTLSIVILSTPTVPDGYIYVIGCWNKDGNILIKCTMRGKGRYIFLVYNLKSGVLHKTDVAGPADGPSPDIFMYPNTLSSIHGINTNSFSMKKTDVKKSCRDLVLLSMNLMQTSVVSDDWFLYLVTSLLLLCNMRLGAVETKNVYRYR